MITKTIGNRRARMVEAIICLVCWFAGGSAQAGEALTFERDVRPIFKAYCLDCHGGG